MAYRLSQAQIVENVYGYFRADHGVRESVRLTALATGLDSDVVIRILGFEGYELGQL